MSEGQVVHSSKLRARAALEKLELYTHGERV